MIYPHKDNAQQEAVSRYLTKGYVLEKINTKNCIVLVCYDSWVRLDPVIKQGDMSMAFSRPIVIVDPKGRVVETTYDQYKERLAHDLSA